MLLYNVTLFEHKMSMLLTNNSKLQLQNMFGPKVNYYVRILRRASKAIPVRPYNPLEEDFMYWLTTLMDKMDNLLFNEKEILRMRKPYSEEQERLIRSQSAYIKQAKEIFILGCEELLHDMNLAWPDQAFFN